MLFAQHLVRLTSKVLHALRLRPAPFISLLFGVLLVCHAMPAQDEARREKPDYRAIVEGLASPNVPIRCRNAPGTTISVPPDYDWKAQERIERNRRLLFDHCEDALPFLIEGCTDARYSLTSHWSEDDVYSWSVGQVCLEMIACHVERFREYIHFGGPSDWHKYNFVPRLHAAIGNNVADERKRQIQEWWRGRKGKSIRELQIETFDWAIAKRTDEMKGLRSEKRYEIVSRQEEELSKSIEQLIAARDNLKRSDKPLPPSKMWPSILSSAGFRTVPWTRKDK